MRRLAVGNRLLNLNESHAARWRRQWDDVPVPDTEATKNQVALAFDLDLFGKGSFFHLVCRSFTQCGREQLRDLLLSPTDDNTVAQRQAAVAELRDQHPWRMHLELLSLGVAFGQAKPSGLASWADAANVPPPSPHLRPLAFLLTAAFWMALVCAIVFSGGVWVPILVTLSLVCFAVALWHTPSAFETLEQVTTSRGEVTQYQALFDHVTNLQAQAPWLQETIEKLRSRDGGPATELARLGRITRLSSLRRAGLLQAVLYMTAQVVFQADLWLLDALQRWRHRNQGRVTEWFERLGAVEAVSSLAGLAFDHPDWTQPDVNADHDTLTAKQLGHPLLTDDARVDNDVAVGPPGTMLLVTGSNMSGKSTLLRSIGLNALLAQAGGFVCAEQMSLPPVRLGTSVRVHDSLSDGVSFFMAELNRLKQVVDMAEQEGPRLLYLLDEILQGTNSAERQIAVSHVLQHLLAAGAIGAISTHDLELASLSELTDHCQTVHFRETLGDDGSAESMTFDYRLRDGVSPTTNALKLLELVGLRKG